MTENIFENGGEFCMRGDPSRDPVEWHWFKDLTSTEFVVLYVDNDGNLESCRIDGSCTITGKPAARDLIPIPSPPQIVPWESPDDVPDGIVIRSKLTRDVFDVTGYGKDGIVVGAWVKFDYLCEMYEYHTDRRAKDGWQPCGKVVQS